LLLEAIRPRIVAAYIEQLGADIAKPSVKQHLAAIRQLFDYVVTGGILLSNSAAPCAVPNINDPGSLRRPGPATLGLDRRGRA
jgi:site-specific recombinase XerD